MKIKKISFYVAPWFLMVGACLTIGLLSFGGMLAMWPSLWVAGVSVVLAVAYEGYIYLKNTENALKKLYKSTYLERQLAKECLLNNFPDTSLSTCPMFFKDYEKQLYQLHRFEGKRLDKASLARKKHVEKTLADMEKWFAVQLFSDSPRTNYQKKLHAWFRLKGKDGFSPLDVYTAKRGSRNTLFQFLKAFCLLAGCLTGVGTSYLLVEAFATIPMLVALPLATLPMLIVPMSVVAGAAYGLLIYNAATDMIADELILKRCKDIVTYAKAEATAQNVITNTLRVLGLVAILSLNVILAICSAGTWWTVVKTTRPLFDWMNRLPSFIMLVMNPLISALSVFIFNVENISKTVEMLEKAAGQTNEPLAETNNGAPAEADRSDENSLQKNNPFRFLINQSFDRLRYLLFSGHIGSIGAATDRAPGWSPWFLWSLSVGNEYLSDYHYFGDHAKRAHKHDKNSLLNERLGSEGHNHDTDLPTKMLTVLFMPLYALAAAWDSICSKGNTGELKQIDFWSALDKEMGIPNEEIVEFSAGDCCPVNTNVSDPSPNAAPVSDFFNPKNMKKKPKILPIPPAWQAEHAAYRIERHKEKKLSGLWFGQDVAEEQQKELTDLQTKLYVQSDETLLGIPVSVDNLVNQRVSTSIYNKHSFFFNEPHGKTDTRIFLDNLPGRVAQAGG